MSEPCRLRRGEGYEARDDDRQDKGRGSLCAPARFTPPRNAGRDKDFWDFQKAGIRWSVCTPWCCVRWSFNGKSASFPHGSSVLWVVVTGGFHAIWK